MCVCVDMLKYALNECFRMFYERINYSIYIQIESKSSKSSERVHRLYVVCLTDREAEAEAEADAEE